MEENQMKKEKIPREQTANWLHIMLNYKLTDMKNLILLSKRVED